jgi:putative photosynthetic complex assembly protein
LWNDAANAESGVIDVRTLIVADGAEGTVVVRDGQTGDAIETVGPGENSFIRHVFRGLAHERVKHGIGADEPFRLSRFEDGRLVLEDPAVGTVVAINAFGADHIRSFARILMSTTGE